LDFLLWMESDRMGHLVGVISQAKLDEQRGVVQNEKRQGENQPYGLAQELITKASYPAGHPYSWTTIGSMEDLNAASLDDVKEWFRTYYGAANATIVVAGDIETETVREKVEKYFGDIPPGPPISRHSVWVAKRSGSTRQIAQDRVPQSRIYKVWNMPEFGSIEADHLNLVSDVLAMGKTSRLYKRLVYDEQLATDVSAFVSLNEIGGQFVIMATARPGKPLADVEKPIDEEVERFVRKGPTSDELERVKTSFFAHFIRGMERIGGFQGKSDILATYQVFTGDADNYKVTLDRTREASADDLRKVAQDWLSDGVYNLEIHPFPPYETAKTGVDRSKVPDPTVRPEVKFPDMHYTNLANGMKVVLAERHTAPLVQFVLQMDAGYASDKLSSPGTAKLAMNMLDEGTKKRTSLQIDEELARLGAVLSTSSDLDTSSVSLSALKANLDPSLELYADVVLNPAFPESDFKRLQNQQLDAIKREKSEPTQMALRVLPRFLYGPDHPYSNPFTGSGTEQAVAKLTRADLQKFYEAWFKPNNATMIIVGDTTLADITPRLEKFFRSWQRGTVPKKDIAEVKTPAKSTLYLMDRPGSIQTMIFTGELGPPKANPDEIAIEAMNNALGGTFTARINMNLREDKHWSYGAHSVLVGARGQRPYIVIAPVQTDKTKESMVELNKELRGVLGDKPIKPEELAVAQKSMTLTLPGEWETTSAVSGAIARLIRYRLPDDYYETYPKKTVALQLADVQKAAEKVVHPDKLVWVVVGDRAKIEKDIRDLGLGEIHLIDTDGKVIN
jgi:zinc protease